MWCSCMIFLPGGACGRSHRALGWLARPAWGLMCCKTSPACPAALACTWPDCFSGTQGLHHMETPRCCHQQRATPGRPSQRFRCGPTALLTFGRQSQTWRQMRCLRGKQVQCKLQGLSSVATAALSQSPPHCRCTKNPPAGPNVWRMCVATTSTNSPVQLPASFWRVVCRNSPATSLLCPGAAPTKRACSGASVSSTAQFCAFSATPS